MLCFSRDGSGRVFEDMMYSQQLCFFFFCFSVFLFFIFLFFLRFRFKGKQGTMRSGLIMILRTVRSDSGSHGFLLFSHRAILEAKRTAKVSDSSFSRSDRTVRSGFQNLGIATTCSFSFCFFLFLAKNVVSPLNLTKMHFSALTLLSFNQSFKFQIYSVQAF